MNLFLLGAITAGFLVASLFFLRFWRETKDRLFLAFGISFLMEAINRAALALSDTPNEGAPFSYVIRLSSYLLILIAIADKNDFFRSAAPERPQPEKRSIEPVEGETADV
jgi:uncharacterized membrane protein HdeD (DUF308 family)